MNHERTFICSFLVGMAMSILPLAHAQDYPSKPIKLIIPFAGGGITDLAGRVVADRLSFKLGQPVIVENRAGGGSRIGAHAGSKASPDGYTLLLANSSSHATLAVTSKDLPYDPIKNFTPIVQIFSYPSVLICNPAFPAKTVQELIDYAKKYPGKVTNGSAGVGSGNHFMNELFNSMAGVEITHIPYRSSSQAIVDVAAGTTTCTFDGASKPYIDSGRVHALAVTGLKRDPRFPRLPTLDEAGLKGYNIVTWQGLVAPQGVPAHIVRVLNRAVNEILEEDEVKKKAAELGLMEGGGSPEQLTAVILEDIARYRKIAKDSNLTFE